MPLRQGIGTDTNIDSSCSPLSGTTARRGNLLEELSSQTYNLDVFATLSARNYSFSYSRREQPVKLATLANGSPPSHTLQSSDWQQGLTTSAESSSQTHSNEEMTQRKSSCCFQRSRPSSKTRQNFLWKSMIALVRWRIKTKLQWKYLPWTVVPGGQVAVAPYRTNLS